jgi:hypothetical protein
MLHTPGAIYCLKSAMYTFSNDCPASQAGFTTIAVPEWVGNDNTVKTLYAVTAVQNLTKKNEVEFVIIRTTCLVY